MDNENAKKALDGTDNTAEAEKKEESAAPDFGKFKSADALLKAYSALEAEFTRRSQRLKELEEENKAQSAVRDSPSPQSEEFLKSAISDGRVRQAVIEDYLKSLASGGVPLISGGVAPVTPRVAPKSVKEAGALAQRFLKN